LSRLLDSQRYLDSVGAFERVGEIKPTGDSIANITMAYYLDRDPENAIRFAQRAADGNPASARASFYGALAKRDLGRYSEATKTLELLAHKYPNSIDIRREYAFALLQSRRNSEARQQYEQVQRIDPDDIAAHYFLSSLYQQNGESSRAEREELTFRDKRDDPRMTAVSVEYLRDHPAEMRESVPWHVHKLN